MPSSSSGVTLFIPEYPIVIAIENLYDPDTNPSGKVIAIRDCLVIDINNDNTIFIVDAVDPNTHKSTLRPARMLVSNTNPEDSLTSLISYGNDIFRVYFDPRTSPLRVHPDNRIVVFGTDNTTYQLVTNPGKSNEAIISVYYDASGNNLGHFAPMVPIASESGTVWQNARYPATCNVNTTLSDGDEIFIRVFNSQGSQTALVSAFAKTSVIVNEMITPDPVIVDIELISTQSRSNNEIYIFQHQDVDSLGIQIQLTYSDGHQRIVPVDNTQCYLYGLSDFIASYPGLRQGIIAKYFLTSNESMSSGLAAQNRTYVSAEADLIVIPNQLTYGVKISTIPRWNAVLNRYDLAFFLYTTRRDAAINVTPHVTISPSTPYNGSAYGVVQNLTLTLDMSQVDPATYPISTTYEQTCLVTLQPLPATTRYIIADGTNVPLVYGADSSGMRRPVLHYDAGLQQYYVPSIFTTLGAFLQSFYINANAPYDAANETQAPTPTHFMLRDPTSGTMLIAAPIPVGDFQGAFSIIGTGPANRYTGTGANVIVEFLLVVNSTETLTLFGVPVDVFTSTAGYNG